jgi:hypothetical protein
VVCFRPDRRFPPLGRPAPKRKPTRGGRKVIFRDTPSKVILRKIVHDVALSLWHITAMPDVLRPSGRGENAARWARLRLPRRWPIRGEATSVAMLRSWSHARRHFDAVIELRHYCDFNELATFGDPNCPAQLQRKLRLDG